MYHVRFILMMFLLFFSIPSHAQTTRFFEESQALTRANPSGNPALLSASATRPLSLVGVTRYRVTVCAESGATLTGTGTIRLWLYTPGLSAWGYGTVLTVTTTGARCQPWGLLTDVRAGWLHPTAVSIGVSGGTTVTIRVDPDSF
jgi:hypothetical protein